MYILELSDAGQPLRANTMPNSRNLTNTEERVIVEHIVNLVERGFPRWLQDVANMANALRAERGLGYVSLN